MVVRRGSLQLHGSTSTKNQAVKAGPDSCFRSTFLARFQIALDKRQRQAAHTANLHADGATIEIDEGLTTRVTLSNWSDRAAIAGPASDPGVHPNDRYAAAFVKDGQKLFFPHPFFGVNDSGTNINNCSGQLTKNKLVSLAKPQAAGSSLANPRWPNPEHLPRPNQIILPLSSSFKGKYPPLLLVGLSPPISSRHVHVGIHPHAFSNPHRGMALLIVQGEEKLEKRSMWWKPPYFGFTFCFDSGFQLPRGVVHPGRKCSCQSAGHLPGGSRRPARTDRCPRLFSPRVPCVFFFLLINSVLMFFCVPSVSCRRVWYHRPDEGEPDLT